MTRMGTGSAVGLGATSSKADMPPHTLADRSIV